MTVGGLIFSERKWKRSDLGKRSGGLEEEGLGGEERGQADEGGKGQGVKEAAEYSRSQSLDVGERLGVER